MPGRIPRPLTCLFAIVLPLAAAACGGDDDDAGTAPTTTAAPATTAGESTTTSAAPASSATTEPAPSGTVIPIEVVGGEPQGGAQDVAVALGDEVVLRVTSDVGDEIHVHGYDLLADVAPGAPAEIRFTADIPGQFEVELEGAGVLLANLTVS